MATNHLAGPHYDNSIMLSCEGEPMTTISDDKVEWYLVRGLATRVSYPGYAKAIRLTFKAKANSNDAADLIKMENRCVVCGTDQSLSLHHVLPYSVKRHYPLEEKQFTRRLCVLLCEEHHLAIEAINKRILPDPYTSIESHLWWLNRVTGLYARFLKRLAVRYWRCKQGGVKAINAEYIDLFKSEMKPKYLPENWLQP